MPIIEWYPSSNGRIRKNFTREYWFGVMWIHCHVATSVRHFCAILHKTVANASKFVKNGVTVMCVPPNTWLYHGMMWIHCHVATSVRHFALFLYKTVANASDFMKNGVTVMCSPVISWRTVVRHIIDNISPPPQHSHTIPTLYSLHSLTHKKWPISAMFSSNKLIIHSVANLKLQHTILTQHCSCTAVSAYSQDRPYLPCSVWQLHLQQPTT